MEADSDTPGWDAITDALDARYPGVTAPHLATVIKWRLGGPDPLDGITYYPRDDHWHLISYGMSELYTKESDIADVSGWGFEFTFRVARTPGDEAPPNWSINVLNNLARYVFSSSNPFGDGHYMALNGPIDLDRPDSLIRNVAFRLDPELGELDTLHGSVAFLQVVGVTEDEYEAAQSWSTINLLDAMRVQLPLLVTDPDRSSTLDNPSLARAVADGMARDGSSATSSYVTQLDWQISPEHCRLVVGALAAPKIGTALRGRLPFGRSYLVFSEERELSFTPGTTFAAELASESKLELTVPPGLTEPLLGALTALAHKSIVDARLSVEVVATPIRNDQGDIVEVIG
jgi:suppressor of fused